MAQRRIIHTHDPTPDAPDSSTIYVELAAPSGAETLRILIVLKKGETLATVGSIGITTTGEVRLTLPGQVGV